MKNRIKIIALLTACCLLYGSGLGTAYCADDPGIPNESIPEEAAEEESEYKTVLPAETYFSMPVTIDNIIDSIWTIDETARQRALDSKTVMQTDDGNKYVVYEVQVPETEDIMVTQHYYFLDNELQAIVYDYELPGDKDPGFITDKMTSMFGRPVPLTLRSLGELAEVTSGSVMLEENQDAWESKDNVILTVRNEGNHSYLALYRGEPKEEEKEESRKNAQTQAGDGPDLEGLTDEEIAKVEQYLDYLKYEETQKVNAFIEYLKSIRKK